MASFQPAKTQKLVASVSSGRIENFSQFPLSPERVERIVVAAYPGEGLQFLCVLCFTSDVEPKQVISKLNPKAIQQKWDERVYLPKDIINELSFAFADKRTLLLSYDTHTLIQSLLAPTDLNSLPEITEQFLTLDSNAHANILINVEKSRHFLTTGRGNSARLILEEYPLLKLVESFEASIDLTDRRLKFSARSKGKTSESAATTINRACNDQIDLLSSFLTNSLGSTFASERENVLAQYKSITDSLAATGTEKIQGTAQLPSSIELVQLVRKTMELNLQAARNKADNYAVAYNLLNIFTAVQSYQKENNEPIGNIVSNGNEVLSWRVALLPFLGERYRALYQRFHLDEAWNSKHNIKLLQEMPTIYRTKQDGSNKTSIQIVSGNQKLSGNVATPTNEEIVQLIDGVSQAPWTKPSEFRFDPNSPTKEIKETGSSVALSDWRLTFLYPSMDHELLRSVFSDQKVITDARQLYGSRYSSPSDYVDLSTLETQRKLDLLAEMDDEEEMLVFLRSFLSTGGTNEERRDAFSKIFPLLQSDSEAVRTAALFASKQLTWRVDGSKFDRKIVERFLDDPHEATRWAAIGLLLNFDDPAVIPLLLRLPEQDEQIYWPTLIESFPTESLSIATSLLKNPNPAFRARAAQLIAGIGDKSHISVLQPLANDPDENCRRLVQDAIEQLLEKSED